MSAELPPSPPPPPSNPPPPPDSGDATPSPRRGDDPAALWQGQLKSREGAYSQTSSTGEVRPDTDVDDHLDGDPFDFDDDEGLDGDADNPEDALERELARDEQDAEAELQRQIAALDTPGLPRMATGPELWVGFDGEWWRSGENENTILTIQLYVPPDQPCFRRASTPEEEQRIARHIGRLSCIVDADGPAPEQRPALGSALLGIVTKAIELNLIAEEPATLVVVGFGLRFDLAALRDFQVLKREVDVVAGRVATVHANAELELHWRQRNVQRRAAPTSGAPEAQVPGTSSLATGSGLDVVRMKVRFIDTAAYVPLGTSLRWIGKLVGREKLDIPAPHSIARMHEYLRADRAGYDAYAMRDAEIAVLFALRLKAFARERLGLDNLAPTASGLALRWFLKTLPKGTHLEAFGLHRVRHEAWHQRSHRRQSFSQIEPTPMRRIQDAFCTDCFKGGRNEAYWLGPTDPTIGPITDYDLAGAYTTGLLDLKKLDFDHPRPSLVLEDYLGHVAGYALVEFEHPPEVRFPVFSVNAGSHGLVFPRKGVAYATAPEILAAHGVGCQIRIRWGVIYPWIASGRPAEEDEDPCERLFYRFVKRVREMRKQLKDEEKARAKAAREDPRDLIEEQFVKLLGNSLTGKCSQGLRPKNVYDSRGARSVQLRPSAITNPAIAAHITGFIRAVLAEILNRIPPQHVVVSATTDGFLTSARMEDLDLTGPLSRRFQRLCAWVVPGSSMLEIKHAAEQVVCMKTRGQLTSRPLAGHKIVVAKAGVQPTVAINRRMTPEQIRRAQNDALLRLYLDRRWDSMVSLSAFPSLRDQWEKGIDLIKHAREIRMSLEFDMKRRLVDARELPVLDWGCTHLAADTRPWETVEDFERARARLDQFRQPPKPKKQRGAGANTPPPALPGRCLKTLVDLRDLEALQRRGVLRDAARAAGQPVMNMGRDGAAGLLKRAFLRAYVRGELGLTQRYSYTQLALWFTDQGLATTTQNVKDAKKQPLVLACVPREAAVWRLLLALEAMFPQARLRELLAPLEEDDEDRPYGPADDPDGGPPDPGDDPGDGPSDGDDDTFG